MPRTVASNATPRFTSDTFAYLTQLAAHNDRPWFEANKQRYEAHVLAPALAFITAMAPRLRKISKHFVASPKRMGGSLMRVYRDTRFARDKSPFKTNIGIQFRHERGRDVHAPGFYLHIEPGGCFLGAGIWHPEAAALAAIRREIVERPKLWQRARDDARFMRHFTLGGASLVKAPRGFAGDAPHVEDLKRKDFIAACVLTDRTIVRPALADEVAEKLAGTRGLMTFLCGALDLPY